jgi:DNA-binding NarL/FixJ family response regulator
LLAAAKRLDPDAILLDFSMPLLNGIDAARQLKKGRSRARLIFLTMHTDETYVTEAFRAGACGYILKRSGPKEMIAGIRTCLQGEDYISPEIGIRLPMLRLKCDQRARGEALTSRQREVLQLVAEGLPNKQMAAILGISIKAVEAHRSTIRQKIGSDNIADLTRYAAQLGLIDTV